MLIAAYERLVYTERVNEGHLNISTEHHIRFSLEYRARDDEKKFFINWVWMCAGVNLGSCKQRSRAKVRTFVKARVCLCADNDVCAIRKSHINTNSRLFVIRGRYILGWVSRERVISVAHCLVCATMFHSLSHSARSQLDMCTHCTHTITAHSLG